MVCTLLLCLCVVVLFGLNLWALGYCFIHSGDDNTKYWPIWIIYAVSIIFMLLLYNVKS